MSYYVITVHAIRDVTLHCTCDVIPDRVRQLYKFRRMQDLHQCNAFIVICSSNIKQGLTVPLHAMTRTSFSYSEISMRTVLKRRKAEQRIHAFIHSVTDVTLQPKHACVTSDEFASGTCATAGCALAIVLPNISRQTLCSHMFHYDMCSTQELVS